MLWRFWPFQEQLEGRLNSYRRKDKRHEGGVLEENRTASGLRWEPAGPFLLLSAKPGQASPVGHPE